MPFGRDNGVLRGHSAPCGTSPLKNDRLFSMVRPKFHMIFAQDDFFSLSLRRKITLIAHQLMAKTIHTILYDDVLDGSKIIEMDNCVCQLSVIRRGYTEFIKEMKEELSKPALYILLNRDDRKAYVGETDVFFKRIANNSLDT